MLDETKRPAPKPYQAPRLTVHGDVASLTRAVSAGGALDGKVVGMGMKEFKTA